MSFEMTLRKYTDFVRSETRPMVKHNLTNLDKDVLALSNALGGECGELQNVVKKLISRNELLTESPLHEKFVLEAGDTLWYLCRLIQVSGYTVERIMEENIHKLQNRGDRYGENKES